LLEIGLGTIKKIKQIAKKILFCTEEVMSSYGTHQLGNSKVRFSVDEHMSMPAINNTILVIDELCRNNR